MNLFIDNFGIIIQVVSFMLVASAYYWKIRIDLKVIDMRIEKVVEDRKEKWEEYDKQKIKTENKLSKQCEKLNEIAIGIVSLKGDIKWIVKNLTIK